MKIWQQTKDPAAHVTYKEARNLANITMREAEYWRGEFSNVSNSKDFWKLVKKVYRKTKVTKIGPLQDDQGTIQTSDLLKSELMNNYFATVGEQLATEFTTYTTPQQFILRVTPSIQELIIDRKLLLKQLTTINPDKAAGPDDIKQKDFCIAGEALADSLYNVVSKSKETRQVPQKWKKGKLKAVYKKGNSMQCSNYRPLTMLCLPSKILEGHVSKQIDEHIEQHNLSNDKQWGYKKGRSTELLLLKITEHWNTAIDNGKKLGYCL